MSYREDTCDIVQVNELPPESANTFLKGIQRLVVLLKKTLQASVSSSD